MSDVDVDRQLMQLNETPERDRDPGVVGTLLRRLRELHVRRSDLVARHGGWVLRTHRGVLGDEVYNVAEQVFLAALDIHDMELAGECLSLVRRTFPGSTRVRRLEAMQYEAQGDWDRALEVYSDLLHTDETDVVSMKRWIAVLRAQGRVDEAVAKLCDYLKLFQADLAAWLELADMYLSEMDYARAAFCLEEALLHAPHNYLFHLKYAEVLFTLGGPENYRLARKYFAQSLDLKPKDNARALYGLFLTSSYGKGRRDKEEVPTEKILEWSRQQLVDLYRQKAPEKVEIVRRMTEGV